MFDYLISNYIGSPIFFSLGLIIFTFTVRGKKYPNSALQPYTSGIISGVGFMVMGIVILIMNLIGKW